ncbi:hypothetical protein [Calothrix sp. NIES-3974]|uniref:hypothetical protein n=1 Tax=Calothrix sp. NIES-3974 TaxID=2005462 RepID=UPI000B618700|nr:hypothetical protein [Calothrix sp. NIES-3974]BAZ07514.1 hypothetical protein NIES3974_41780 [Calothrix sp. NIES-3974]
MNYQKFLLFLTLILTNPYLIPTAKAESSQICTFTTTEPGDLVRSGQPRPTKFVTFADAGGTPVQMEITCQEPARLSVSAPIQLSGPELNLVVSETIITTTTGATTKTGDTPLLLPVGTTGVTVNMVIDRGQRLRAGSYRFTFKLNFMPQ